MTPTSPPLRVRDHGTVLTIGYDDCVRYHGRTSIGGVALGYRLMERAFADLTPDAAPDRATIRVRTAFPGPGLRDAVEMITRAVSRGAYVVDLDAAPAAAPEAVVGRLWFEIGIGTATAGYVVAEGAMGDEFVAVGRRIKAGAAEPALERRWTELKEALAVRVMMAPSAALFRSDGSLEPTAVAAKRD